MTSFWTGIQPARSVRRERAILTRPRASHPSSSVADWIARRPSARREKRPLEWGRTARDHPIDVVCVPPRTVTRRSWLRSPSRSDAAEAGLGGFFGFHSCTRAPVVERASSVLIPKAGQPAAYPPALGREEGVAPPAALGIPSSAPTISCAVPRESASERRVGAKEPGA